MGSFFLDETFSWLRLAGLGLILGAALLLYGGKDRLSPKVMALCGVIFLLNGAVSVFSKEHAISTQGVSAAGYVILTALVKVVLCGGILLGSGLKKSEKSGKIKPKALVLTALSALISGLSYLLQLNSAAGLPATVVYPIVTGGSIVFTAVAGWLILKERPTKRFLLGVVICFAGTCLFL